MRKEKKKVWNKRTPDNRHLRRADGELLGGSCACAAKQGSKIVLYDARYPIVDALGFWFRMLL
jgi:hypothetical protein